MQKVTITEASQKLAQFIDAALKGEEILIVKDEQSVVKLTALEEVKRYPEDGWKCKGFGMDVR